jgi:hypothetical protein
MATHEKPTEAPFSLSIQSQETLALLKGIIVELRKIGAAQARQDERIEALIRQKVTSNLVDSDSLSTIVS